jgi:hypothetical protein
MEGGEGSMKGILRKIGMLILVVPLVLFLNACDGGIEDGVNDAGPISSGKILFAAHNTTNPDGDLRLFVINDDGTGLAQLTNVGCTPLSSCDSPDIEDMPGGGWRIAYVQNGEISVFDTRTGESATVVPGGRPDFNEDASVIVFQGGGAELNIWKKPVDGSSAAIQLTNSGVSSTAEWPYFSPVEDRIVYVSTFGEPSQRPRQIMDGDGSNSVAIPPPGGDTVSHMGFKADGTEFADAQTLTSYSISTGAIGTLSDLKNTTTMMYQLSELGYKEVPTTQVGGQAERGTFALSVDWSRDGKKLVFDALVQDVTTGSIKGIALFVYAIDTDKLTLIFGPEPFNGSITNNFNFSTYTPKWIP